MPRRIKFGHGYYYIVTAEELRSNGMKGKKVVLEGTVDGKPLIEFLPMELPSYRTSFTLDGLRVEFAGAVPLRRGERVKVYGVFIGHTIVARAIETEGAVFTTEE